MKSQTLESESPKTSKQKALLEMLSPLQCHSQVYDGTLGLICFKLGNIASWQSINPDEPLWWMFEFKKILLWAPLNVCFRKFGCQSSREFLLGRINFEANQTMFLLCFLQQNIGQLSNLMLTNNKLQHSCDRVSRHLPTKPKSCWCDFLWSAVVFWESPFPTWFSSIFITSPFIVNPYKVIFTLPTWYVFGSLKRGKKYLQGEWISKATKHQEPKTITI